ncbi:MAG TPA: hypothetical protein VFU11_02300 [Solirubrobacterales bacterium]|nr:hypothetical protein [Solirubrobacterales bacterium]
MTQQQKPDDNFEERLLTRLKAEVAERGAEAARLEAEEASTAAPAWRRRAPRLAFAGGAAVAALATVIAINAGSGNGSKAFAVETQDGGGTTIKVNSPEDAPGLEAALAEAGIRSQITWLPAGMTCSEPRFEPSTVEAVMGGTVRGLTMAGPGTAMTIGVMTAEQYRELSAEYRRGEISGDEFHDATGNVTLDPTAFGPDQSVVISGAPGPSPDLDVIINGPTAPYVVDPEGGYEASFAIAEGPVGSCEPVKAPKGGSLEEMNRVIAEEAAERGIKPITPAPASAEAGG